MLTTMKEFMRRHFGWFLAVNIAVTAAISTALGGLVWKLMTNSPQTFLVGLVLLVTCVYLICRVQSRLAQLVFRPELSFVLHVADDGTALKLAPGMHVTLSSGDGSIAEQRARWNTTLNDFTAKMLIEQIKGQPTVKVFSADHPSHDSRCTSTYCVEYDPKVRRSYGHVMQRRLMDLEDTRLDVRVSEDDGEPQ